MALQNIIDNACKYSKETVTVRAFKTKSEFQITVSDKGIGIPSDEKEKIFDTFYRGRNTHGYKGAGIGLSLAHKILTLSGAVMEITSTENRGTTISIIWKNSF